MANAHMLSIDLAKRSFQVCATDRARSVLYNRTISRPKLKALLKEHPCCKFLGEPPHNAPSYRIFEQNRNRAFIFSEREGGDHFPMHVPSALIIVGCRVEDVVLRDRGHSPRDELAFDRCACEESLDQFFAGDVACEIVILGDCLFYCARVHFHGRVTMPIGKQNEVIRYLDPFTAMGHSNMGSFCECWS